MREFGDIEGYAEGVIFKKIKTYQKFDSCDTPGKQFVFYQ